MKRNDSFRNRDQGCHSTENDPDKKKTKAIKTKISKVHLIFFRECEVGREVRREFHLESFRERLCSRETHRFGFLALLLTIFTYFSLERGFV